jgi:hypothetical protein
MNPEVDQILMLSASQLMGNLGPSLPDGYAQGQAALLSLVMMMSAQEYERGADIRVAENTDIRATFRELAPTVLDDELRTKLENAVETPDTSLAISALNATNANLRRLLIALQAHVEQTGARDAQARIWDVLKRSAARRLVKLG